LTGFEVEAVPGNSGGAPVPLDIAKAEADYTQEGHDVRSLIDGREGPGWAVQAFEEKQRVRRSAYFTLAGAAALEEGARLRVRLLHQSQWPEANVGRFRLSVTSLETPVREPEVPDKIRGLLAMAPDERDEKQTRELDAYWRSVAPDFLSLRDELERVRKEREELDGRIARTLVMQRSEKERETRMLMRGNFLDKGEPVLPGVPAVFHSLPEKRNPDRQDLARWLVDERNPLTARVTINRMWERYFGIGLVETGEDFGTQGEKPSHPRLLDWLADEFMRQGWRMKTMHKLIVMSAAYRQSSAPPPDLVERDPYNRLLARGPRVRLEAEMLRDQALAVSGLLSDKLGGPSVMPPQPEGLWQVVYSGDDWKVSEGEDRYRRGLYTFWRRTNPHPMLTTFDAPSREFCVVQRNRSNTPLQALVLLNDPVFVEAAQALARRMVVEAGSDPAARATHGFRLGLAREPSGAEVERLVELHRQGMEHYAGRAEDAARMAPSELEELPEGMEAGELAAWTVVANVLLNLDELITKP
ncbi:MAG TPA: DUF1553 domain-containing protein, partial [Methylomirabilota bacterium]|nr:DUF1553 domain-containing protein [Methylomirabilota bacterium]